MGKGVQSCAEVLRRRCSTKLEKLFTDVEDPLPLEAPDNPM
jgi:hypothetical protein